MVQNILNIFLEKLESNVTLENVITKVGCIQSITREAFHYDKYCQLMLRNRLNEQIDIIA